MATGRPHSIYFLGYMYYWGKCVQQDHDEAIKWFRKAAEVGDKDGMYYLGKAYEKGNGVENSRQKAIEWYQKALSYGSEDAEACLTRLKSEQCEANDTQ